MCYLSYLVSIGTIAGVARRLKEYNPNIIVVGVDPIGSILAQPEELNVPGPSYLVEGIGYDFIPRVCDRTVVDRWVKSVDRESLLTARKMIRDEGLLCGGSSGAAMYCALQAAQELGEGQRCVVLLADSVRNYMSKFLSDSYMWDYGFVDGDVVKTSVTQAWWASMSVASLPLSVPVSISPTTTCREAIALMNERSFDMVPVQSDEDGSVLGVLTEGNLTSKMTQGKVKADDSCVAAMYKQFRKVRLDTPLGELARIFDRFGCSSKYCGYEERNVGFMMLLCVL
jgi:cystathionine beta-synthase